MELSAVLSLKDKLSANMNKATNSIGSMVTKVNDANNAILAISKSRGINITATTNIQDTVKAAKSSIDSLKQEIEQREIVLKPLVGDIDTLSFEEIDNQIATITKDLENPKKSLEEIQHAKEALAQWQEIGIQYEALVKAKTEVEVLERALEQINKTNVAVRAYVDFKKEALQQIYDLDNKVIKIKTAIQDKVSPVLQKIKSTLTPLANKVFSPILKIKDSASAGLNKIKSALAKVAGTVAYPIIKIKDAASPIISKVGSGLKEFAGKVHNAVIGVKDKATPVLKGIKVAAEGAKKAIAAITTAVAIAGTALAGGFTAAVQVGQEFEQSAAKASTLFGDVAVDTQHLNSEILKISTATGVAATELNEGLYSALSAGIPATEDMAGATAFLESSTKLAKAGFTDMDTALSATAKTLNAYKLDVSEADRIQGILIQTQNKGITTVGELGASLAQVTPTAAAFGVSFENVGAALATMTAQGTPTAQATTQLNSLIAELGKNGTVAAKNLEAAAKGSKYAGMSFNEMMNNGASLDEVLGLLNESAKKNNVSLVDMFSSIEAGKSALAIMSGEGETFRNNLSAMGNTAGLVDDAYNKMMDTFAGQTSIFKESSKNLGIAIYQGIQEPLKDVVKFGNEQIAKLSDAFNQGGFDGLVSEIGNVLASVMNKIVEYAPQLINMAIALIQSFVGGITANLPQIANGEIGIIRSLADGIRSLIPSLIPIGVEVLRGFVTFLLEKIDLIFTAGIQLLTGLATGIIQHLPELISLAQEVITNFCNAIVENIGPLTTAAIQIIIALANGIIQSLPQIIVAGVQAILTFCMTLVNNLPQLVTAAINIIMALVDGILQALPLLLEQAPVIIANLVNALVAAIPQLIQAAIQIIVSLVQFILNNLGMIIQAAIQIVFALITGLIGAIPSLVAAIPQLIFAIIDTILSTNWLEVGWEIIKGIVLGIWEGAKSLVKGVWEGIKGIFKSGGKDCGTAAVEGIESGLNGSMPTANGAATNVANGVTTNLMPNMSAISEYGTTANKNLAFGISNSAMTPTTAASDVANGTTASFSGVTNTIGFGMQADNNLAAGINSNSFAVTSSAQSLVDNTKTSLDGISDTSQIGANVSGNLAAGIDANSGAAISAAGSLSSQVESAASSDVVVNIVANSGSLTSFKSALNDVVSTSSSTLNKLPNIAQTAMSGMANAFKQGFAQILQITSSSMSSLVSTIQSVSLYSAGVNIMSGLNRGLLSMKSTLISTARSIANSISKTINDALEIKSPSRVTTRSGRFTGQGLANGLTDMIHVVKRQADRLVSVVVEPFDDEPLPVTAGGGNNGYRGMLASVPVSSSTTTNNTNTSTTYAGGTSKRITIQNLIGKVTVRDEADEDRLVDKIIQRLADEMEEADDNMGEEDLD